MVEDKNTLSLRLPVWEITALSQRAVVNRRDGKEKGRKERAIKEIKKSEADRRKRMIEKGQER